MNWLQLRQSSLDDMLDWAGAQPWCRAMAECVQDAEWHSEGDVWTHTQMVCRQLENLDEWPALAAHERTVLILTALLHDVAKPLTSQVDPETGRVVLLNMQSKGSTWRAAFCVTWAVIWRRVKRLPVLFAITDVRHSCWTKSSRSRSGATVVAGQQSPAVFVCSGRHARSRYSSMTRPEENLHFWKLQPKS